jgi:hypothetical protein
MFGGFHMLRKRLLVTTLSMLFGLGIAVGPALAHHDGLAEFPPRNPHAFGVPQELWDAGVEGGVILDGEGVPVPATEAGADPGFAEEFPFVPVSIADGLNWEDGNFWFVLQIGVLDPDVPVHFDAIRVEEWAFIPQIYSIHVGEPITPDDLVDPSKDDGVTEADGDFFWILLYPHEHHIILNEGTPRERCVDLANQQTLTNPNQHNAVHIGTPGQTTPHGFANAGHEIHVGTCADRGS